MGDNVTTTDSTITTTVEAVTDWRAGLTGEYAPLAQDKSLESFKGKDWTEVGPVLAKSYVEARKLIGTKPTGLVVPGEKATPEEKAAYDTALRKTLGVPDAATGYKITRPDVVLDGGWNEAAEAQFLGAMHKAGASPQIVQAAIDFYGAFERAKLDEATTEAKQTGAALRTEWGPNYEAKMGRANRAIQEFGGDALIDVLAANGLGRHPLMVKAWAAVGDALVEHGAMRGDGLQTMSGADAQTKLHDLRTELSGLDENHPRRGALVDEIIAVTRAAGR